MNEIFRITVDTNVFVSMLLGSKNCRRIYKVFVKGKLDLVISDELFNEISDVLKRDAFSKIVATQDLKELKDLLKSDAEWVKLKHCLTSCRDPKDNIILETALSGKVDFIVSGDKDLLDLKQFHKIPIVTPKQFSEALSSLSGDQASS
ncbi:MAG: putative toxin-antitoxin system toxin component, PIN family [Elusimicrobia bacterium]|nr:putative toxin-antitoxin system toxin component, PIN family [Elusimicrobiota bacterium]